ncbi:MAG TPA: flippase [Actinomycetota bacterium]|nr:flippase [Actinomycetota bacterium]
MTSDPQVPDATGTRRFAANAAWLIAAEIAGKLASFVFAVIVARGLGPLAYGYFNIAISLGGLVLAFGSLGLNTVVTTEIVRRRDALSEIFSSALVARLGIDLVALVGTIACAPLLVQEPVAVAVVGLVGTALLIDDISSLIGAVFKAVERMRFHALAIFTNRLVSTVLAVVAVAWGGDILAVCVVYLVGSVAGAVFATFSLRRNFSDLKLRAVTRMRMTQLLRAGAPLGVASILNLAVFRLDSLLLQVLKGPIAVAMYGVAFRFFDSLTFLAYSLTSAALPRLARDSRESEPVRAFQLTSSLLLVAYLPIAAGTAFAGRWVVVTIFSARYEAAAASTTWLAAGVLFYGIAYLGRVALIAADRRREVPRIAAGALVLNVALNLMLIPRLGFEGAAIATFFTEIVDMTLTLVFLRRALPGLRPARVTLVPVVATLVMTIVLMASGVEGPNAIALGAPVYLVALIGSGYLIARDQSRKALSVLVPRLAAR